MVSKTPMTKSLEDALLDITLAHTILRSLEFFSFQADTTKWENGCVTTIAGQRTLKFKEGEAKILLLENLPIIYREAMYALDATRNLITY